ncbi:sugar phosphate isomerase/epimerase family protein [Synoicihabitans lomoniglobus]|uniref:Sugar phosphate isomerase/epimerase n=1 Tax=Synoicihabitans lomoniglobus TaxID=2909285 RepID=A0AAE9ZRX6_9BACT|nr:sugar phosphate isomerase/epimerase [Opitutaceae bacterium LMO-M01]WED63121.1 sugar phosphate isomerase/epimerase [Opitutaceae bacterium LMO-M01]
MQFGVSTWLWNSSFNGRDVSLLRKIAAFGFDFVEIPVEDPAAVDGDAIRDALRETGLQAVVCAAVAGDRDLSSADPRKVQMAVSYLTDCFALARDWGCPLVAGPLYAPVGKAHLPTASERQEEWDRSATNLRRVAGIAADHGVHLALEPINRFETDMINTAEDAKRLIDDIGSDVVGISLDSFHMNIEEVDWCRALATAGDRLFHLQVSDSHRGVPGEGNSDWAGLREGLRRIGYDGRISIESFSPDGSSLADAVCIWRPFAESQDAFAERGLHFLKQWHAGDLVGAGDESK